MLAIRVCLSDCDFGHLVNVINSLRQFSEFLRGFAKHASFYYLISSSLTVYL